MKKYLGIIALVLVFAVVFTSCKKPVEGGVSSEESKVVESKEIEVDSEIPDAENYPNTPVKAFPFNAKQTMQYEATYKKYFPDNYKFDFTPTGTDESFVTKVEKDMEAVYALARKVDTEKNSVKAFGAVGDGKTDDTQAFMTALKETKSKIYIPEGEYVITKQIGINGKNIVIYGNNATILLTADVSFIRGVSLNGVLIKGLNIKKTFVDNSVAYGVFITNSSNVVIDNNEVSGLGGRAGFAVGTTTNFIIANNYSHDFSASKIGALADGKEQDSWGIEVNDGSKNGIVRNNTIENLTTEEPNFSARFVQTDGIYSGGRNENILIEKNKITKVGEGIDLGKNKNVILRENTIIDIWVWGIKIGQGSRNCLVEKNYLEECGMAALYCYANMYQNGSQEQAYYRQNVCVNTAKNELKPGSGTDRGIIHFEGNDQTAPDGNEPLAKCINNCAEYNVGLELDSAPAIGYGIKEHETARDNIFRYNYFEGNITIESLSAESKARYINYKK